MKPSRFAFAEDFGAPTPPSDAFLGPGLLAVCSSRSQSLGASQMYDFKPAKRDSRFIKPDPEAVVAFLRTRHPIKTAEAVEAETGVPAHTVKHWLERGVLPSFLHCMALIGAYGPEFLVAALPRHPRWLQEVWRAEKVRRLEEEFASLRLRQAELGIGDAHADAGVLSDSVGGGGAGAAPSGLGGSESGDRRDAPVDRGDLG